MAKAVADKPRRVFRFSKKMIQRIGQTSVIFSPGVEQFIRASESLWLAKALSPDETRAITESQLRISLNKKQWLAVLYSCCQVYGHTKLKPSKNLGDDWTGYTGEQWDKLKIAIEKRMWFILQNKLGLEEGLRWIRVTTPCSVSLLMQLPKRFHWWDQK